MFFCQTFCSKNFSTAPLTLGFSQLISVGQKSSVTNSGVKRVIFEIFTFYFAQRYSIHSMWNGINTTVQIMYLSKFQYWYYPVLYWSGTVETDEFSGEKI